MAPPTSEYANGGSPPLAFGIVTLIASPTVQFWSGTASSAGKLGAWSAGVAVPSIQAPPPMEFTA